MLTDFPINTILQLAPCIFVARLKASNLVPPQLIAVWKKYRNINLSSIDYPTLKVGSP